MGINIDDISAKSEQLFAMLEQAPALIASPAYVQFLDKPLEDIVGHNTWELLPEAEVTVRPTYETARTTRQPLSGVATPVPVNEGNTVRETYWDLSINVR